MIQVRVVRPVGVVMAAGSVTMKATLGRPRKDGGTANLPAHRGDMTRTIKVGPAREAMTEAGMAMHKDMPKRHAADGKIVAKP